MAQKIALEGYPFNKNTGRGAQQSQYTRFARYMMLTGVVSADWPHASSLVTDELEVYADSSGMQVKVKTGEVAVRGFWAPNTAEQTLAIDAADGSNPRIDLIVARLENLDTSDADIYLYVKTGTPAATPSAPSLTQTEEIYEISLAQVYVAASVVTINAGDITDLRSYNYDVSSVNNRICNGRLTLSTGVPVPAGDVTAATSVYFTPFRGNQVAMPVSGGWKLYSITELELKLTDTQNGDTVNSSTVITGLTSTTHFVTGMVVSGTGIQAGAVIVSVDSETQVTLDLAATADGSDVALTFKMPADTNLDISVEISGNSVILSRPVKWTNATTRSTALTDTDGVLTLGSDQRVVGTIRIGATDGQCDDSVEDRNVCNLGDAAVEREIYLDFTPGSTHSYGTNTWRPFNNDSGIRVSLVCCDKASLDIETMIGAFIGTGDEAMVGIGFGSTSTNSGLPGHAKTDSGTSQGGTQLIARYRARITAGYYAIYPLEKVPSGSVNFGGVTCGLTGLFKC